MILDRVFGDRREYAGLVDRLTDVVSQLLEQNALILEQNRLLVERMKDMERQGYAPPVEAGAPLEQVKDVPAVVLNALQQRTREGSELWFSELERAQARLANGEEPDAVAKAIMKGGSFNPW